MVGHGTVVVIDLGERGVIADLAHEEEIGPAVVVVIAPGTETIVEAPEEPTGVGEGVCAGVAIEFCAERIATAEEDVEPAIVVVISDAACAARELVDIAESAVAVIVAQ